MRRLAFLTLIALFVAISTTATWAGDEKAEGTLTGEVLDMYCYMKHPDTGQGPDHAKCARTCINKGLPIGFLAADGTVYLIVGKDHESAAKMVVDYAGKQSTITGVAFDHDGVKAIEILSIKDV
jgi:hypothetical protein